MAIGSRSSAADLRPAWVRWLFPSAGDLIFVALLGLLVFTTLSVRLLGDAGIGWHIRTGQLILATHAIPRDDPFSSTVSPTLSSTVRCCRLAVVPVWLTRAAISATAGLEVSISAPSGHHQIVPTKARVSSHHTSVQTVTTGRLQANQFRIRNYARDLRVPAL